MDKDAKIVVPDKWPELIIAYWGGMDECIIEQHNKSGSIIEIEVIGSVLGLSPKELKTTNVDDFKEKQ